MIGRTHDAAANLRLVNDDKSSPVLHAAVRIDLMEII